MNLLTREYIQELMNLPLLRNANDFQNGSIPLELLSMTKKKRLTNDFSKVVFQLISKKKKHKKKNKRLERKNGILSGECDQILTKIKPIKLKSIESEDIVEHEKGLISLDIGLFYI